MSRVSFRRAEYGAALWYTGYSVVAGHTRSNSGMPSAPRGKSLEGSVWKTGRIDDLPTRIETKKNGLVLSDRLARHRSPACCSCDFLFFFHCSFIFLAPSSSRTWAVSHSTHIAGIHTMLTHVLPHLVLPARTRKRYHINLLAKTVMGLARCARGSF